MAIDWFTVAAQIVNFLVLIWLLHRFLYGPIIRAMDTREAKIAERLKTAEEKQAQADDEAESYRRKQRALDERQKAMMGEMQAEVEARRNQLLEDARFEIEEQEQEWRDALKRDQDKFLRDLRIRAGQEIFAVARRALSEIADVELERQLTRSFLRHIQSMDENRWRAFLESVREARRPVSVRTAFDLPHELRNEIEDAIRQDSEGQVHIRYETTPNLIAGLELEAHSCIAAWNLEAYLNTLEERTAALLSAETPNEGATEHAAEPA